MNVDTVGHRYATMAKVVTMRGGWWAAWVAVTVATTLAVALLLGWVPTIGVLLASPLLAVPQWSLLRPALPRAGRWLAATGAGLAVAPLTYLLGAAPVLLADYVYQFILRLPGTLPLVPFVVLTAGAGAGAGIGLCQGLALAAGGRQRWAWAFAAASAVGGGAMYAAYAPVLSHVLHSIVGRSPDATASPPPYQLTPALLAGYLAAGLVYGLLTGEVLARWRHEQALRDSRDPARRLPPDELGGVVKRKER